MDRKNLRQAGPAGSKTGSDIRQYVVQASATALFVFSAANAEAAALVSGIGAGRLLPGAAAITGLIGIIIGRRALIRAARTGDRQPGAFVAGILGLTGVTIGVLHAANSAGGFGTGNGLAGAIVAIAVGLIAIVLSGLAFIRSRRAAPK